MINKGSLKKAAFSRLVYENMLWRGLFLVSSLLLNIFVARYYQAGGSGWIFYVFNYYTLFVEVLGFSMEAGISYYTSRDEMAARGLLGFSLALSAAATVPVVIFSWLYVPEVLHGIPRGFVIFSAVCFTSGNILNNCCSVLFFARRNFILPNLAAIVINGLLIALLLFGGRGRAAVVWEGFFISALFASYLLLGLVMFFAAMGVLTGRPVLAWPGSEALRKVVRYSRQAFLANTIFFLLYRVDYWFVERYCSPAALGNYIQVSKLVQVFLVLPTMIAGVIFPVTAGGQREEVYGRLKYIVIGLLLLYGTACMVIALAGGWLFPLVFGASFTQMQLPFLLLIPGILSLSLVTIFSAYYAGKNRVPVNIKGALLALLIILPGDIIFIPRYGIAAAALVSSAGYMAYIVYVARVFKKDYALSMTDFFRFNKKPFKL